MPDLSTEQRAELAAALYRGYAPWWRGHIGGLDVDRMETDDFTDDLLDALLPVLARVVAEAKAEGWDEGYGVGHDDEADAHYDIGANPYRAEASGREGGQDA